MPAHVQTIDVHAHIIPPQLAARWSAGPLHGIELVADATGGRRLRIEGGVTSGPIVPGMDNVERRLERMDEQGIDVQVLSPFVDTTAYVLPRRTGQAHARSLNEHLAAVVAEHPDRFQALGTVPLQDPQASAEELERIMALPGFVGCQIATTVGPTELDAERQAPFWAVAEALGALVLLHPHAALAGRDLTRFFLWNLVGNPAESTVALGHLLLSGTLERFPELRLCSVHGGGFLPYQLGRLDRGYAAMADKVATKLTRSPSEWAQHLYYDALTHDTASLRLLLDRVGPGQVVLGSDHPFAMGEPDPVGRLASVPGLSETEREAIAGRNLMELFASSPR